MKLYKNKYSKIKAITSNSQFSAIPIEMYDHDTDTTTKFHAITAAAKALGIDKRYIENYIYLNQKKPVLGKYTFKLLKKDFNVSKVPLVIQKTSKTIEVLDLKTNTKTVYHSISQAARILQFRQSSISLYLKENRKQPFKGRYLFKLLDNLPRNVSNVNTSLNSNSYSYNDEKSIINDPKHKVNSKNRWKFLLLFKKHINSINLYLINTNYYLTKFIDFIVLLFLVILLLLFCIFTKNQDISFDIESLIESEVDYNKDFTTIKVFEDVSNFERFLNYSKTNSSWYFNKFIELFLQKDIKSYNLCTDYMYNPKPIMNNSTNSSMLINIVQIVNDCLWSYHALQQNIDGLQEHLSLLQQDNDSLNRESLLDKRSKVMNSNLVIEVLDLCKNALTGQPYKSPMVGQNSQIFGNNSPIFRNGPISGNNSPILDRTVVSRHSTPLDNRDSLNRSTILDNRSLISDINTLLNNTFIDPTTYSGYNSPYVSSPLVPDSTVIGDSSTSRINTSVTKDIDIITDNYNSKIVNKDGYTTSSIEQSTFKSSPLRTEITDYQKVIEDNKRSIIKSPITEIISPDRLKRFGHVFEDKDYEYTSSGTRHSFNRYGCLTRKHISVFEDHNASTLTPSGVHKIVDFRSTK